VNPKPGGIGVKSHKTDEAVGAERIGDARAGPDLRRWRALALLCAVNFMVILDSQIVILGVPSIEQDLGFSADGVQWVLSAYLLSFGGLLLLGGRAGDLLGRRRVLIAGTILFGVSSLVCGLAWSPAVLVAARVAQGVSAAIMAPTALAILMTTFPEGPERNKALALWGGLGGLGATAALLIGGTLTDALGWEAIFLINLPVAAVLLALSPRLLRESRGLGAARGYDPAGALTLTAAPILLILAVVEAPDAGWTSASTLALLASAAALLVGFVLVETRSRAPLVPLRIFRSRTLVAGNLVMLLAAMIAWGMSLTVSLYAQQVLGLSALQFGLGTAVMTGTTLVGSYVAQGLVTSVGPRPIAAASMGLLAVGSLLLAQVSADGSYFGDLFLGLLIFGPGLGAGTVAGSIAALSGVRDRDAGVASGTNTAAFQIGGAVGTAIAVTVAAAHTAGPGRQIALTEGYQAAFTACAIVAISGLAIAIALLRRPQTPPSPEPEPPRRTDPASRDRPRRRAHSGA
jgi:EmrB/QacA subfamily drug resistance transporter